MVLCQRNLFRMDWLTSKASEALPPPVAHTIAPPSLNFTEERNQICLSPA